MQTIPRFWQSLEDLTGCATVAAEWRQRLGDQFDAAPGLLRASGELATFYPHHAAGQLPYRVVTHGPNDHVGVCDDTGERYPLSTEELTILELDCPKLYAALASLLGLTGEPVVERRHHTVQLGWDNPLAGYRFPAFLLIHASRRQQRQAAHRLAALHDTPLLLLSPTRRFLDPDTDELLRRRNVWLITLEESIAVDGGQLVLTDGGRQTLAEFHTAVLPAKGDAPAEVLFPTPPGSRWSEVSIRLVDGHTVSVAVGDTRGMFNYTQMGLADRRNGAPTRQWELLRALAQNHGLLTWGSPAADRRNKKRRELLAHALQRFFRIAGDPIQRCGNGWRTRFSVAEGV